jgi:tetratricopeptide (TPR) repeat protein
MSTTGASDPQHLFDQATSFHEQGLLAQAEPLYRRLLAEQPHSALLHHLLGTLCQQQLRQEEALALFDRAVALAPDFAEAWNNRGIAQRNLGRFAEALASFERALAIRPDYAMAWNNRGRVLLYLDRIDDGIAAFMRFAELRYGTDQNPLIAGEASPPNKLRHDREQADYQASIAGRHPARAGARLAGPAVTPGIAVSTQTWRTKKPQIAVIDNFLTPPALEGLRRYCLEEPVWRSSHRDSYLGAFIGRGFACPLLGQIARELRAALPAVFRDYTLQEAWAFKYDSELAGINVHADEAAVNVNFWLTPDEANLDPDSGGLVIWDVAAPLDWEFDKFNNDNAAIRDFLARNGAQPIRVPYRANRAVIFDSDLFHQTDTIRFKPGYLNRRINVTLLYGLRAC